MRVSDVTNPVLRFRCHVSDGVYPLHGTSTPLACSDTSGRPVAVERATASAR
jgi:hypothetical protein